MNLQSVRWAFNAGRQHCTEPGQLALLLVIASAVRMDHRGCVLSMEQLASASLMTTGEVEQHLASLDGLGLIHRGDATLGEDFGYAPHPAVWDLACADRSRESGPRIQGRTMTDLPYALYRFFDDTDQLLYVGVTLDRDLRWANHTSGKIWWPKVARSTVTWYQRDFEARHAEAVAIRDEGPLHNVATPRPYEPVVRRRRGI